MPLEDAMPLPDAIRETFRQGRPDNPSSWRWIVAYYEYVTMQPFSGHCLPLLDLVRRLSAPPYAQDFRAGQSVNSLLISTKSENGLDTDDPRIYVEGEQVSGKIRMEYWRAEWRDGLVEGHLVAEEEVLDRLKPLLARLWDDTRGRSET